MENIAFYRPKIDQSDRSIIEETLNNPMNCELIDDFENTLKKYFGSKYAISTSSGTAAKHLILCAMDIKRGDKIICSVNSFVDIAEVVRYFDAEPIFVDISEDDFNINPSEFEKAIIANKSKKLKCAFITHVGGQSAKMDEIYDIAKRHEIDIIDDATHSMGATYKGKKIGSFADSKISCFQVNTQFDRSLATAGFIITNDDIIAKRAILMRNHAIVNNISKDGSLGYIYDVVDVGTKYTLSLLDAAFSLAQVRKIDEFIARRLQIAKIYDEKFRNCTHVNIPVNNGEHIYTQYIIKIDKNRDGFAKELMNLGITTSLHYVPLNLLSYYKNKYNLKVNDFPSALRTYQQVLSLPIYPDLSDEEVHYICESVLKIAKSRV